MSVRAEGILTLEKESTFRMMNDFPSVDHDAIDWSHCSIIWKVSTGNEMKRNEEQKWLLLVLYHMNFKINDIIIIFSISVITSTTSQLTR